MYSSTFTALRTPAPVPMVSESRMLQTCNASLHEQSYSELYRRDECPGCIPVAQAGLPRHSAEYISSRLGALECQYREPYLRFSKPVKVPRGQASFALDESFRYSPVIRPYEL